MVRSSETRSTGDGAASRDRAARRVDAQGAGEVETAGREVAPARPLAVASTLRLQRAAGNRAVSGLVATRRPPGPAKPGAATPSAGAGVAAVGPDAGSMASGGGVPAVDGAPVAVQRLAGGRKDPGSDPKLAALRTQVKGKQQQVLVHRPAKTEADAAQGAAVPPQDDKVAQGKVANAEKMNAAKPGEFDKAGFVKAVNDAIAAQAPKNLDEADNFSDSGKADRVKGEVQGKVTAGKQTSAAAIDTTTKAPPDTAAAREKPVTPLQPDTPPPVPPAPDPANATPDKAPPAATDFSAGPAQVTDQMAGAQVTEGQLAKSNEPEFTGALAAKKEGEAHAATAPGLVRGRETKVLADTKAHAAATGATAMNAIVVDRRQAGAAVASGKQGAKGSDESKRTQVTGILQKVFDATKKDVEDILSGLDKKVDDTFTKEEAAARAAFTADHQRRMDAYKDARYSGWSGKLRWVKDKFAGLPEEANQIFVTARAGYVTRMQQVISTIADQIGTELGKAKQRIATGREQLQAEVKKLPADLQAIGKQAAGEFGGKFDELTETVNNKSQDLVQTLASKYSDALKDVDAEIDAEKEKNKGLIAKAVDAVGGVIKTILQLKDLLLGVLAKAASAVMAIIKDPIAFLGHLISAVGAGLKSFIANIGEHLKKGLIGWLLGAMAGTGLQLPAKFDLRGILSMIASLLGLTWASIRGRIVQRGVPEQAMGAVEQGVPMVAKIQSEGIGGVWEQLKEKLGDLKTNLFGKIAEYLIPTVLVAGITWIISLLNPASAFIKACKMIIDIVTFIIDRGAQIIEFVNAVLDAVIAIAGGAGGGVPALIEGALAKSIPVLIGALAAILGIGGIADKVKKFFQSLSKPVMKAVDWVVGKIVGLGKKIWAKLKGKFQSLTDKRTPEQKQKALDDGLAEANRLAERQLPPDEIRPKLPAIKAKHKMTELTLVVTETEHATATVHFEGAVNPKGRSGDRKTNAERVYPLTFTKETRPEFRLVENPADRFPRAVQQKLDRAQETVYTNNQPSASKGDGSTQYAAIAEAVAGGSITTVGDRPAMHIGKNSDNGVALGRWIADEDFPEHAKEVLAAQKKKSDEAKAFVEAYRKGESPTLPAWAGDYKSQLVKLGLDPEYPVEEPEGRRGKGRRR
jgi:hypothetical protein